MLWDDHCSERQTLLRETKQICQKFQCWFYLKIPIEMTRISHSLNISILILNWGGNPVRISKDMIRIGQKAAAVSKNAENQVKWFCTNLIPTVGVCRGVLCLGLTVGPIPIGLPCSPRNQYLLLLLLLWITSMARIDLGSWI